MSVSETPPHTQEHEMPSIRKVQATNPHTGDVTVRTSKSKVYTHALVVKQNAQETFAIPAGTYTVPASRIQGRRISSYQFTLNTDDIVEGREESWAVRSFHTSFDAAAKAGRTEVSQSLNRHNDEKAVYGDAVAKATPMIGDFEVVEVEVLDEGFNA
ncbi:hypothetical protein KHO61_gp046 [Mycobacterium phage Mangeria]|uniref:Uncharacterized protein n=1 Tax=Mycobacterium phage Mangeria TaxID=2686471 RepID=A0A6B9LVS6_9CAUD|nr:hypothetical protein KHO61_gp046 [Mycobacterium phage Mangeria]QHB47615.1 hypothetical protein SEA_MANGERIA_46 [Mycobacterium phage Mangeria]